MPPYWLQLYGGAYIIIIHAFSFVKCFFTGKFHISVLYCPIWHIGRKISDVKSLIQKHFVWFSEKIDRDAVDSYAAQVSFWILIAFIPFVMFVLTLLQIIRFEDTTLLFAFANMMPEPVEQLLRLLFSEIRAPQGILSMTAIVCVWSASTGMLALVKGLYAVFDVPKKRNFIFMRVLAILYTLALAIILLVSMGLLVFGDMLYEWLIPYMPPAFPNLVREFKPLMGFAILLLFFWLMFIAIPRKQVSWRNAFWGAALAAAGWVLFSFFFSIFVENFSNYATIYGSLAAIIILMMWLYICMFILLIGGELAMWLQHSSIKPDVRARLGKFVRRKKRAQKGNPHGKTTQK